jgi:hypothetical protein
MEACKNGDPRILFMYDPCDISHYSVGMYDWINDEEKTKGLFSKFYSIYGSFYKLLFRYVPTP